MNSLSTFPEMFQLIGRPLLRSQLLKFHRDHFPLMREMPASVKRHHCWPGGYYDHVLEVCQNAIVIQQAVPLPLRNFILDDLILAAYVHDLDKLFCRYVRDTEAPSAAQVGLARSLGIDLDEQETKSSISAKIDAAKNNRPINPKLIPRFTYRKDLPSFAPAAMVVKLCYDHGLTLTDMALHAITYHEGGWSPGLDPRDEMQPIIAVLHAADMLSACAQNGGQAPVTLCPGLHPPATSSTEAPTADKDVPF